MVIIIFPGVYTKLLILLKLQSTFSSLAPLPKDTAEFVVTYYQNEVERVSFGKLFM